jgi:hypothetical protein
MSLDGDSAPWACAPDSGHLAFDEVIGGVYSAMPAHLLPPPTRRPAFAGHVRRAMGTATRFTEHVRVAALIGYRSHQRPEQPDRHDH